MHIRLLVALTLLAGCSASGQDVSKRVDISADMLAEIRSKPYIGGNGPGGFAAAALTASEDGAGPQGIAFTGFGPYLHEMGFNPSMMITAIDGTRVHEIFTDRWMKLRLRAPDAFDAAHYKDLVEYLFSKEPGARVVISLHVKRSAADLVAGVTPEQSQTWLLNFEH
jgi:hypothetical protein